MGLDTNCAVLVWFKYFDLLNAPFVPALTVLLEYVGPTFYAYLVFAL